MEAFGHGGEKGEPCYGQVSLGYAESEEKAGQTALEWWPSSALPSPLSVELRSVEHFEQAAESVTLEQVRKSLRCGPYVNKHREAIEKFLEAGYDHIYIRQVGPEQKAFRKFFRENFLMKPIAARKGPESRS